MSNNLTDNQLAEKINAYLAQNPYASRKNLVVDCKTSYERIFKLADAGLIKLPARRSVSISATQARKRSGAFKGWYINKPAPWQVSS